MPDVKDKETQSEKAKRILKPGAMAFKRYFLNWLLILLEVFAIAILTVLTLGFDGWEYLYTPQFIVTSIMLFLIYSAAHWTVFNSKIKRMRFNDEHIKEEKDQEVLIRKTTKTKEWVNYHKAFLSWRRVEKKKESWETHVKNELTRLTNKVKHKDSVIEDAVVTDYQREHLETSAIIALQTSYDEARRTNKYCAKKRALEEKLTDTWIAANISKINVDFDDVDNQFVETGSLIHGVAKSKTEEKGKYAKDNWGTRIAGLALSAFITAFTIDLLSDWRNGSAWVLFGFRILFLIVNIVFGLDYADGFFRDVDLHNMDSRLDICDEFWTWRDTNDSKYPMFTANK